METLTVKYQKIKFQADVHQFINYKIISDCIGEEIFKRAFSVGDLWKQLGPDAYMKSPFAPRSVELPTNRSDWRLMQAQILSARESEYEDIPEDDAIAVGDKPNVVELLPLFPCKNDIPLEIQQLSKKFEFYKIEFFTKLLPKKGHRVKQLFLTLTLSPGYRIKNRPAAYDIFPDTQWETILKIHTDATLDIGIGFHLGYIVRHLGKETFKTKANVDVGTKILGSFAPFVWKRALVESGGQGSTCIEWRYRHKTLLGDISAMLVMKVRKSIKIAHAVMHGTAVIQTGRLRKETFPYRIPPQKFELLPI